MKTVAYLADLRHNFGGVLSIDTMPLGIGYLKAVMDHGLPADEVESEVFAYADDLLAAIDRRAPDVIMVSNYVWNERLSLMFLRRAKRANPNVLAIMGGPNISIEADRQLAFVQERPEIDVYVMGEADFIARDLVAAYLSAGRDSKKMGAMELPSCIYRRPNGELFRALPADRNTNVNDIPSPFLTGVMDKFFDGKLAPMIETNRGCPFRCSFCVQGTTYYNRITNFDLQRLKDEIDYIADLNHQKCPQMGTLRIADANYGMYERDEEISGHIGLAQARVGWPTFIDATTGKNRPDRIIRSMEKVNGALVLYQAVQSLDEDTLRNIRRSNIKLDAYEQIQVYVRGRGMRSTSDLILGLPGESLKSHLGALHKLIDAGTNQAHCFQAMMLKGSDMESLETRSQFRFDTRFRVLPKNYGIYGEELVFDIEEIIVATDTLPFEDYLRCRQHHLTFSVFWNDSWFEDVVQLARQVGIKPSEWLVAMLDALDADTGQAKSMIDEFTQETIGELFPTRDACEAFYREPANFERLRRGQIGDNLMYKYRALASFFIWEHVCAVAMKATRKMLVDRGVADRVADFDGFWNDLARYVEAKHASGQTADEVTAPVRRTLSYDLAQWRADGGTIDTIDNYRQTPREYIFSLDAEGIRELDGAMRVWSMKLTGLSKLVTRIRITSQVRDCKPVLEDVAVPAGR